ncbi:Cif family virulence factor [Leptothoe spongobia]|uniref:hypothetical protein n=1 Tax=Leptothoe spongobia TaxID=2651728 RepID=UPI001C025981|nr:hypothetical protein [Leptothoe spongobia]
MVDANEVLKTMCEKYQAAVSANDSIAYGKLFATDAIRIPPRSEPEHGPDEISKNEQKDYDVAKWRVKLTPLDASNPCFFIVGDQVSSLPGWQEGAIASALNAISRLARPDLTLPYLKSLPDTRLMVEGI